MHLAVRQIHLIWRTASGYASTPLAIQIGGSGVLVAIGGESSDGCLPSCSRGCLIKYGYQAWRAGIVLAVVFLAVLALSVLAQHDHVMVPVGSTVRDGMHPQLPVLLPRRVRHRHRHPHRQRAPGPVLGGGRQRPMGLGMDRRNLDRHRPRLGAGNALRGWLYRPRPTAVSPARRDRHVARPASVGWARTEEAGWDLGRSALTWT